MNIHGNPGPEVEVENDQRRWSVRNGSPAVRESVRIETQAEKGLAESEGNTGSVKTMASHRPDVQR